MTTEGIWTWYPDEIPLGSYSNWFAGEPNGNLNENCGALNMYGEIAYPSIYKKWADVNCQQSSRYVCFKNASSLQLNKTCQESDWTLYEDKCYKLFQESKSFWNALNNCQNYGTTGELAEIDSLKDQEFITHQLLRNYNNPNHVYFGATNIDNQGNWEWYTSKNEIQFTNWADQQGQSANQKCALIFRNVAHPTDFNKWHDVSCNEAHYYICAQNAVDVVATTTAMTPVTCQTDWTYFQGKCYKLFTELKSFSEAMSACQSYGADLTQVENQAVSDFLLGTIKSKISVKVNLCGRKKVNYLGN